MISNHYAMTFGAKYNWLVLIAMTAAGALIRVYFVSRHFAHGRGEQALLLPAAIAVVLLAGVIVALSPSRATGLNAAMSGRPAAQTSLARSGDRREALCRLPHLDADSGRRERGAGGRAPRCAPVHPAAHRANGEATCHPRDASGQCHGNDRTGAGAGARMDPEWCTPLIRPRVCRFTGERCCISCQIPVWMRPPGASSIPDGVLIVRDGRIDAAGPADALLAKLPADTPVTVPPTAF